MSNLEERYNSKIQSCKDRMVEFNLSLEEWKALWKLQLTETCAYLNLPFNNNKQDHGATVERISDEVGYTKDNVVLVTKLANDLKNNYVFLGKDVKGLNSTQRSYVHRIKKVLSCEDNIERIKKPYKEAFDKIGNKNLVLMKEQKEKKHWEDEITFAKYYVDIAEEFQACGVNLEETIGNLRKIVVRCKRDQVTGEVFDKLEDKVLWVVDKTKPVKQGNIKVVTQVTRNALDTLTMKCDISKLALNLHKVDVNK